MSYLLDRKTKRNRNIKIATLAVVLIIGLYFHSGVHRGFSSVTHVVFRPVMIVGGSIGNVFSNFGGYFAFKSNLTKENEALRAQINEMSAQMTNYNTVLDENNKLKIGFGRDVTKEKSSTLLAAILSKPNQSPYDTIIIDAGINKNIVVGARVFGPGEVPLGKVREVYPYSANVVLFSNSGERTEVVISGRDNFMQLVGRGGGNFEMILPRDFTITKGDAVVLPGIVPHTVAIAQSVISDPRDSFQKALLVSPINIQEIKFVAVELK